MMNNYGKTFQWRSGETFQERSTEEGLEPPRGGIYQGKHSPRQTDDAELPRAAVADFDGDGRLDIVVATISTTVPTITKISRPKKGFVAFRLQGTKSNRDAIGAIVKLYIHGQILTRQVNPAGGYLTQSSRTVHFGLGDWTKIDKMEILWPSGLVQNIDPPTLNTRHDIIEQANK